MWWKYHYNVEFSMILEIICNGLYFSRWQYRRTRAPHLGLANDFVYLGEEGFAPFSRIFPHPTTGGHFSLRGRDKSGQKYNTEFLLRLILFIITRQIYLLLSHLALFKQIFDIRINLFSTVCFIYHIIYIITN